MAIVKFDISEGTLSGIITLQIICIGVAPMLCAASIMFGSTSRRLLSTSLATNGNAATVSGTTDAIVPIDVPIISLVSGITSIIRIRNGMLRKRFITIFKVVRSHFGRGKTPFFSPTTRRTPSGSPITIASRVERRVT